MPDFGGVRGLTARQQTVSGLVTAKRCRYVQLLVQHGGGGDEELRFYDSDTTPEEGAPYYSFWCYGKGNFTMPMPAEGVIFQNGVYIVLPEATVVTVTSFFEEF